MKTAVSEQVNRPDIAATLLFVADRAMRAMRFDENGRF